MKNINSVEGFAPPLLLHNIMKEKLKPAQLRRTRFPFFFALKKKEQGMGP
ncbi:MAG: hypothetical protein ACI8ZN_001171 [Bacteroidia bacterium]|jgi:hypothetical protein